MPVHFKTASEYKSHYRPLQSFKSASFEPEAEQMAPAAGCDSDKLAVPFEPPIQRKKRIASVPPTSLSTEFNDGQALDAEPYSLLGSQDKFSENVMYRNIGRNKDREVSPAKQMKLQTEKKQKPKENVQPMHRTAPAPVVNTGKFRGPSTPLAPRKPKGGTPAIVKESQKESKEFVPDKGTVNLDKKHSPDKAALKDKQFENMNAFVQTNMKKGIADSGPEATADFSLKYKAGVAPPRPTKKMSEYQKNYDWKKRVPSSPIIAAEQVVYNNNPQVAPFKRDIVPKQSEYNSQFKPWKFRTPREEREEEQEEGEKHQQKEQIRGRSKQKRPQGKRSKSAGAVLTLDKMVPAGSAPVTSSDNRRLTKESERTEPQREVPKVPQAKFKKYRSEYKSNFKAPTQFDYLHGAWRGASPPQLKPQNSDRPEPTLSNWFAEVIELRRKAEEYRRRAQGTHFSREHLVQLLAEQTEAWDMSTARTSSSTLSALSLESGASARARKEFRSKPRQPQEEERYGQEIESDAATIATEDEQDSSREATPVEEEEQQTKQKGKSRSRRQRAPQARRKEAWTGEEESIRSSSSPTVEDYDENEGRLPTPKLRETEQKSKRHHLDRTTPAVGGAILTSPPVQRRQRSPVRSRLFETMPSSKFVVSKEPVTKSWAGPSLDVEDSDSDDALVEEPVVKARGRMPLTKTYSLDKGTLMSSPTFGVASRDTHVLRDDEVSVDRPLLTQFVHTPVKGQSPAEEESEEEEREEKGSRRNSAQRSRPNSGSQQGRPMSAYPQHRAVDIPSTIDERMGETYKKPAPQFMNKDRTKTSSKPRLAWPVYGGAPDYDDLDDAASLSDSVRSIASSCSLASEVYERARKRRDEFWGKGGIATR